MKSLSINQKEFIAYLLNNNEAHIVNNDILALRQHALTKLNNIPIFDIERRQLYNELIDNYDNFLSHMRDAKIDNLIYT